MHCIGRCIARKFYRSQVSTLIAKVNISAKPRTYKILSIPSIKSYWKSEHFGKTKDPTKFYRSQVSSLIEKVNISAKPRILLSSIDPKYQVLAQKWTFAQNQGSYQVLSIISIKSYWKSKHFGKTKDPTKFYRSQVSSLIEKVNIWAKPRILP